MPYLISKTVLHVYLKNITKTIALNHLTKMFTVVRRSAMAVVSKQSHHSDVIARFAARTLETEAIPKATKLKRPVRNTGITLEERAKLRAVRKERATKFMADQQQVGGDGAQAIKGGSGRGITRTNLATSHYIWYLGVGVPAGLLIWGFNDENSPPAQFCRVTGITSFIRSYTDVISKPVYDKLLPDWSQMPNVPHDIPIPHTLVLDLENTLVSSTWDRKHGWRHAKRPGVDKFLREMAQYYEIVLYSPSIDGIAEPVVNALDKDGCIMHRLYRDATHYTNGAHVKDLSRLNRDVKRMIVIDDDPDEVQFNHDNWIRVKPYTDPTDRTDNTLERITPFLIEIARENYSDIPALLRQYQGMDAEEIAAEQDRRLEQLRQARQQHRGLGSLARNAINLPEPELPPSDTYGVVDAPYQLTAKDIAGAAPPTAAEQSGFVGWLNRRAKEKEEHNMRKMEKWQEIMMKKQKEREDAAKAAAS